MWIIEGMDLTPEKRKAVTQLQHHLTGVLDSHRTVRPASTAQRGPRPPSWWTSDDDAQDETVRSLGLKL